MVIRQIPYRQFDHTGDLGLEVEGTTLRVLFENAGRALFDLLCDLERVRSRDEIGILVEGVDRMVRIPLTMKETHHHFFPLPGYYCFPTKV